MPDPKPDPELRLGLGLGLVGLKPGLHPKMVILKLSAKKSIFQVPTVYKNHKTITGKSPCLSYQFICV